MKTISSSLSAHLVDETTTLATCWKLTRRDGTIIGCTSHDSDIVLGGVTYLAATGYAPDHFSSDTTLAPDTALLQGLISSAQMTEADLLAGLYDFAEVEIFLLNAEDTTQGVLNLRTGWLGEVRQGHNRFEAEISGLAMRLGKLVGNLYSPQCRASLGDTRCGVDVDSLTVSGSITSVVDRRQFSDSSRTEAMGYYNYGVLSFTSGANSGLSMEVKFSGAGGNIELVLPMPYEIAAGDAYTLTPGCDKNFRTCINKFSNAVNFRGEPHIPGTNRMLETSSTRG